MTRLRDVQDDDFNVLPENWCAEKKVSAMFTIYHQAFLAILAKFLSILDDHLGCINAEKHRIALLENNANPARFAPYQADTVTEDFLKFSKA